MYPLSPSAWGVHGRNVKCFDDNNKSNRMLWRKTKKAQWSLISGPRASTCIVTFNWTFSIFFDVVTLESFNWIASDCKYTCLNDMWNKRMKSLYVRVQNFYFSWWRRSWWTRNIRLGPWNVLTILQNRSILGWWHLNKIHRSIICVQHVVSELRMCLSSLVNLRSLGKN